VWVWAPRASLCPGPPRGLPAAIIQSREGLQGTVPPPSISQRASDGVGDARCGAAAVFPPRADADPAVLQASGAPPRPCPQLTVRACVHAARLRLPLLLQLRLPLPLRLRLRRRCVRVWGGGWGTTPECRSPASERPHTHNLQLTQQTSPNPHRSTQSRSTPHPPTHPPTAFHAARRTHTVRGWGRGKGVRPQPQAKPSRTSTAVPALPLSLLAPVTPCACCVCAGVCGTAGLTVR
jgi:hypothetical protein